jgi:release factor glutamine methyltransferase
VNIQEITNKYGGKIDYLDLEILIAHSLGKTREFVLIHPDHQITKAQNTKINKYIQRRIASEPVAHILGQKEFFGINFVVNKHTLIPRPETEMMVEEVLSLVTNFAPSLSSGNQSSKKTTIIDIGTGSGCIITSITNELENKNATRANKFKYYATDISNDALKIAKKNAKIHNLNKKIKFLQGSLLSPLVGNWKLEIGNSAAIVIANLPYLSKEIYSSAPVDVKKYEPKSALYSPEEGLQHYRKLLTQINKISSTNHSSIITFLEISPEQKNLLAKLVKSIMPKAKTSFQKDLAGKWRVCKISI